jgi:excisionase family DNA binding protein
LLEKKEREPEMDRSASNTSVLNVEDAARILGISRNSAYEAVARGEIPSLRFGKRIVIPKVALDRLLSGGSISSPGPREGIVEGPTGFPAEQVER